MHAKSMPYLIYSFVLLLIFAAIPFHAPLSVFYGTLFPDYDLLVKSWKEILLLVLTPLAVVLALKQGVWRRLVVDKLFILIALYAFVHVILLLFFDLNLLQMAAGLAIDLRYLLFFVLLYIAILLVPSMRDSFLIVGAISAGIVTIFSLLQIFILPVDVLKYIGYGSNTIEPYLTIDKNTDFIRINGTLRGPNPLGAYVLIIMSMAAAFVLHKKNQLQAKESTFVLVTLLLIVSPIVLWASYSRSALVAAIVSVLIVVFFAYWRRFSLKQWAAIVGVPALLVVGTLFAYQDSAFVQNVIVHNNPNDTVAENSNEGHVDSLAEGTERTIAQPFGAGPGSTGSASLLSDSPFIVENQYLFIAHESGWLGVLLFIGILLIMFWRLWLARSDWLSVGVLASGLGLSSIGLLLPVWVDDTVAVVWWGLAAIALASEAAKKRRNHAMLIADKPHENPKTAIQ